VKAGHKEIETRIVDRLIELIGKDQFEIWVNGQHDFRVADNRVLLVSSSSFAQTRVLQSFRPAISEAVEAVAATIPDLQTNLEFQIDDSTTTGLTIAATPLPVGAIAASGDSDRVPDEAVEPITNSPAVAAPPPRFLTASAEASPQDRLPTRTVESEGGDQSPVPVPSQLFHKSGFESAAADDASARSRQRSNGEGEAVALEPRTPRRIPDFDLSQFEFDDANQLAKAAVDQLLKQPGHASPLFLHGPVGSGKTHLLRGIVTALRQNSPKLRALYMTAEQFTSSFIEALNGRGVADFRRKCRGLSVLAIDDIHFFGGKKATLIEFQNTLESLSRAGKHVMLAADRSLMELRDFDSDLISRIGGGLPCNLNYVQTRGRKRIVQRLLARRNLQLDDGVIQCLATNLNRDVRLLSGALNRIEARMLTGHPITESLTRDLVADLNTESRSAISIRQIEKEVSRFCGVERNQMRSPSRRKPVADARMLAMFLSRRLTGTAFSEIGHHFGGRSHSTVISANKKIEEWMKRNHFISINQSEFNIRDVVKRLEQRIRTA